MSSKVFISSVCLSLHTFLRPHIFPRFSTSSTGAPNSLRKITIFSSRKCTISCMSTVGANSGSSPLMPKSVPVQVAHELLQSGHRYLDVRTPEEFTAGHAVGAINVPLLFRAESGMAKNPKFLEGVSSHFAKEDEIVVGCQAGKRSLMAAKDLLSAGYTGVTDVAGGYAAWTQNGLPIESCSKYSQSTPWEIAVVNEDKIVEKEKLKFLMGSKRIKPTRQLF